MSRRFREALADARAQERGFPFDIGPLKANKWIEKAEILQSTPDKVVIAVVWQTHNISRTGIKAQVDKMAARQQLKITGSSYFRARGTGPDMYRFTLRRSP